MTEPSLLGLSQRQPPTNIVAEQALLGAILANNKAYDAVSGFLLPEHFADPVNGRIYGAAAQLIDGGRLADVVSLNTYFVNSAILEEVGGTRYLAQLLAAMVGIINAKEYGQAIHGCWLRRRLIEVGETLVNRAMDTDGSPARDILEAAEEDLYRLAEHGDPDGACISIHAAAELAFADAAKARDVGGGLIGLTTGLAGLDEITAGWRRGDMIVVGARPSMGKTSLALRFVAGAMLADKSVLLVSKEMSGSDIGAQVIAGLAPMARDVAMRGKRQGRNLVGRFVWEAASDADFDLMFRTVKDLARRKVQVDACPSGTVAAIRSRARRMKRRGGLDLVVIDYLQLLRAPGMERSENRVLEVTRISNACKWLAQELDVPVIVLSQLSRENTKRENKRPQLPDLRDSGSIEQDADVILFLHREEYYLATERPVRAGKETDEQYSARVGNHLAALEASRGQAEVIVAKQRKGRLGTVALRFDATTTWFRDAADDEVPD